MYNALCATYYVLCTTACYMPHAAQPPPQAKALRQLRGGVRQVPVLGENEDHALCAAHASYKILHVSCCMGSTAYYMVYTRYNMVCDIH